MLFARWNRVTCAAQNTVGVLMRDSKAARCLELSMLVERWRVKNNLRLGGRTRIMARDSEPSGDTSSTLIVRCTSRRARAGLLSVRRNSSKQAALDG